MKCPICGTEVQPGEKCCPSCGAQQMTDQAWGNPSAPSVTVGDREITKSEFCKTYALDATRKNIRASAILCYISAVVTGVLAILVNPLSLIDAAVLLVMGLVIQLKQSRVCAVILLAYSIFSCVITLVETGRFTGWLIILAGVFAVIYTFRLEKEYQAFRGSRGLT